MDIDSPIEYPQHLETATPLVLPRAENKLRHPPVEQIYIDTFAWVNSNPAVQHPSVALLEPTAALQPLLKEHWNAIGLDEENVHEDCLVLSLSSSLNGTAAALAGQWPHVFNDRTLDLMDCWTFWGWNAHLPGESAMTTFRVSIQRELTATVCHACSADAAGLDWKWMLMVVIDDDTVAIGGFVVDMHMAGSLQAASMSCHRAFEIYSEEELAVAANAAEIHGREPWLHDRWWNGEQWLVEAPVLIGKTAG